MYQFYALMHMPGVNDEFVYLLIDWQLVSKDVQTKDKKKEAFYVVVLSRNVQNCIGFLWISLKYF